MNVLLGTYRLCIRFNFILQVKKELVNLLQDLPTEFDKVANLSKNLQEARSFYSDFTSFTHPDRHVECLPLLKFLMGKIVFLKIFFDILSSAKTCFKKHEYSVLNYFKRLCSL